MTSAIRRELKTGLCAAQQARLAAVFCGTSYSLTEIHGASGLRRKARTTASLRLEDFRMPALDPTGMFRMSFVGHMRFEPSLTVAETYDYILRIGEVHPMIVLGECLYAYRILPNSLTRRGANVAQKV